MYWTESETRILLEIWARDSIQAMLTGTKRNTFVFREIAEELEKRGVPDMDSTKVQLRLKYLRKRFREAKKKGGKTDGGREFLYYHIMDGLVSHADKATEPSSSNTNAGSVNNRNKAGKAIPNTWEDLCLWVKFYARRTGEQVVLINSSENPGHDFFRFRVDGTKQLRNAIVQNLFSIEAELKKTGNDNVEGQWGTGAIDTERGVDQCILGSPSGSQECQGEEMPLSMLCESGEVMDVGDVSVKEEVSDSSALYGSAGDEESDVEGSSDVSADERSSSEGVEVGDGVREEDEDTAVGVYLGKDGADEGLGESVDTVTESVAGASVSEMNDGVMTETAGQDSLQGKVMTEDGRYQCQICEAVFDVFEEFTAHAFAMNCSVPDNSKYQALPVVFDCRVCGLICESKAELKEHRIIHTVERSCQCNVCGTLCSSEERLESHIRVKHIQEPRITKPSRYKQRTQINGGEFMCEMCGKGFKSRWAMQTHKFIHTEKPFACDLCGKRFLQHAYLVNHKRIHTGEKPFNCPHCGKAFRSISNLNVHVRIHTGFKPHVCSLCGATHRRACDLKKHMQYHSDERPHKCPFCMYRSKGKRELKQHILRIHNEDQ